MQRKRAQWTLTSLALALTAVSVAYRLVKGVGYGHTSLMFVGIPLVLSLLLIFSPASKSPRGLVFKGTTLFLLMTGILLSEGFVCILMAAPLFYAVGFLSAYATERFLRNNRKIYCTSLGIILLLSLEGVHELTSWNRHHRVAVEKTIRTSSFLFEEQLTTGPRWKRALPTLFKLGFPTPQTIEAVADGYRVRFSGPDHLDNLLHIDSQRAGGNSIIFTFPEDTTKVGEWLAWKTATLEWSFPSEGKITLYLQVHFERHLDPVWYFAPMQKYAVRKAAEYLLDSWFDERLVD